MFEFVRFKCSQGSVLYVMKFISVYVRNFIHMDLKQNSKICLIYKPKCSNLNL